MSKTGTRVETKYRESKSKTGEYSTHIPADVTGKLVDYCEKNARNKKDVVCEAILHYLDWIENNEHSSALMIRNRLANAFFNHCESNGENPIDTAEQIITQYLKNAEIKALENYVNGLTEEEAKKELASVLVSKSLKRWRLYE